MRETKIKTIIKIVEEMDNCFDLRLKSFKYPNLTFKQAITTLLDLAKQYDSIKGRLLPDTQGYKDAYFEQTNPVPTPEDCEQFNKAIDDYHQEVILGSMKLENRDKHTHPINYGGTTFSYCRCDEQTNSVGICMTCGKLKPPKIFNLKKPIRHKTIPGYYGLMIMGYKTKRKPEPIFGINSLTKKHYKITIEETR